MSVYNERILELGGRAADLIDTAEDMDESTREVVQLSILAADFEYQVKNGGFGQLIYNLGRNGLDQCDGMLRSVGAPVALSYYIRALQRCAEDVADFDTFMTDFGTPPQLGEDLEQLSVEYLKGDTGFEEEIIGFLDTAEAKIGSGSVA